MGLSQQSALLRSQVHRNEFGNPDENSGIMFKASSKSADGREALPVFAGHSQPGTGGAHIPTNKVAADCKSSCMACADTLAWRAYSGSPAARLTTSRGEDSSSMRP